MLKIRQLLQQQGQQPGQVVVEHPVPRGAAHQVPQQRHPRANTRYQTNDVYVLISKHLFAL